MKKHFMLFFVGLIFIGWTVCAQAMELVPVTSFDSSWITETLGTGTGTVATDGAKVNLGAQGTATDYGEIDFHKTGTTGIIGMVATLRIDQAFSSSGSCQIGIYQYVGEVNNSRIQISISLEQWTDQKRIKFRVRAADKTTNAKTVLATGFLGDSVGDWAIGDSKTVAFARVGSEFWFCVVGSPGLIKMQLFDAVTSYDGDPNMVAWAAAGNSISGSVSDIYLIKE